MSKMSRAGTSGFDFGAELEYYTGSSGSLFSALSAYAYE